MPSTRTIALYKGYMAALADEALASTDAAIVGDVDDIEAALAGMASGPGDIAYTIAQFSGSG